MRFKKWYQYLVPKRLTLRTNPAIFRWLFWTWRDERKDPVLHLRLVVQASDPADVQEQAKILQYSFWNAHRHYYTEAELDQPELHVRLGRIEEYDKFPSHCTINLEFRHHYLEGAYRSILKQGGEGWTADKNDEETYGMPDQVWNRQGDQVLVLPTVYWAHLYLVL